MNINNSQIVDAIGINDKVTLSIVSHLQVHLVRLLLDDLSNITNIEFEVILTINIDEEEIELRHYPFPIRIIKNSVPKGFGANHNAAFNICSTSWFAVVNPDIRIPAIDFYSLLLPFKNSKVAAIAPLVCSDDGRIEDSARRFPTPLRLATRVLLRRRVSDYAVEIDPYLVDWVAGMFIVFRSVAFKQINGFDDRRFFMYLEDADISRRLWSSGWWVMVNPRVRIIHAAQRASRRNLLHMRWHIVSAIRYFTGL